MPVIEHSYGKNHEKTPNVYQWFIGMLEYLLAAFGFFMVCLQQNTRIFAENGWPWGPWGP